MTRLHVPRRTFLKGSAAALSALPLLPLPSEAADSEYPKRILWVFSPNGTVMDELWPNENFELGPILSPLENFKSKLTVLRGLDHASCYIDPIPKDHWPDFMNALTARQGLINADETSRIGGISIDQHIVNGMGQVTQYPSLQLGVISNSYGAQTVVSALGPDQPLNPIRYPEVAFENLFSELKLDPFGQAKLRAQRGSVLDLVQAELEAAECQMVGPERARFQQHLAAVESLEASLQFGGAGASCTAPMLDPVDADDIGVFPDIITQMFRILHMSFACDITRVATLQLHHSGSNCTHPWLDINNSHHGISHGSEGVTASDEQRREWLIQIETWYATKFAELLGLLDSTPEGDGTMLDHSLVIWVHEQQNGNSHNRSDHPYVIAGGLHGTVETGRRADCGGVPHNALLISLANLMDVPTDQFGDEGLSSGGLPELPYA